MTDYARNDVQLHPMDVAIEPAFLNASVEFGVLQSSGNCTNIGICRINTTHFTEMAATQQQKRHCPLAATLLSVSPTGRLQAFFPRSGMKACTERIFFRSPVFPVPVAYFLPESIQNSLPGLLQPIINAGLYPISRRPEGYFIEF